MFLFVMLYVWQNIEVIRIELECRRLGRVERELREEHNRLRAAAESLIRRDILDASGPQRGYHEMGPADLEVIKFEDRNIGTEIHHK